MCEAASASRVRGGVCCVGLEQDAGVVISEVHGWGEARIHGHGLRCSVAASALGSGTAVGCRRASGARTDSGGLGARDRQRALDCGARASTT
jgi:hypothetical protein